MVDEANHEATTKHEAARGVAFDPADTAFMLMQEHEDVLARRKLLGLKTANPSPADAGANSKPEATAEPTCTKAAPSTESYYNAAHAIGDVSALCLSGGGIRSAAFALGVLQGLARLKLLHRFDYLSTVSGGGYIGGWLTAWVHRHSHGYAGVEVELAPNREPERQSPLAHLWRYSNFLTPHTGVLSSDTLTAVVLYLRNLLLNWLVIVPFVIGAIIIIKLVAIGAWKIAPDWVGAFAVAAMTSIGWAILDSLRQRPGWETRTSNRFRFFATELLPLAAGGLLASIALIKYYDNFKGVEAPAVPGWTIVAIHLGIGGAVLCLVAWLFAFYFTSLSVQPPTRAPGQEEPSVTTTIAEAAGRPGDLKHVAWAAVSFTIAGAVTGVLLATIVTLLASAEFAIDRFSVTPEDVRALLVLCFGLPLVLLAIFLGEVIYAGLTSYAPWGDAEREWLARAAGQHAFAAGVWMIASVLVLFGSIAVFALEDEYKKKALYLLASSGGTAGAVVALLGKASTTTAKLKASAMSWTDLSLNSVLLIGTVVFVVCSVALLSAGFDFLALGGLPLRLHTSPDHLRVLVICVAMILLGSIFSLFVNVNRFSLHGIYRDRIIRAFLGASRRTRAPNPFTDFDQHDNIHLESLWPNAAAEPGKLPPQILVVNMALNILHFGSDPRGTSELAWQERKALPFTASARFVGCGNLEWADGNRVGCFRSAAAYARGARPVAHVDTGESSARSLIASLRRLNPRMFRVAAETLAKNRKGLSLGTALTLSGAAASPNMGYHSSPALSILLTLFNVRLGGWYGNPGQAGSDSFWRVGPGVAVKPLFYEALGLADDHRRFVYLSDGGHFENLGVYEMIRRRCRFIVVSDAGCDPKCNLEDLGNLVRKVSVDFGVKIDFGPRLKVMARQTPAVAGSYAAIADIIYPERASEPGKLLYIKPGFHGNEPASARSYGFMHPTFPHEPTTDQWFGESQFEAYRALGEFVIGEVLGNEVCAPGDGVAGFIDAGARNLARQRQAPDPGGQPKQQIDPQHTPSPRVPADGILGGGSAA